MPHTYVPGWRGIGSLRMPADRGFRLCDFNSSAPSGQDMYLLQSAGAAGAAGRDGPKGAKGDRGAASADSSIGVLEFRV